MAVATAVTIRAARPEDFVAVSVLLLANALPLRGIPRSMDGFFVAEQDGAIVGAIGMEHYGTDALLRSAVVNSRLRGTGLGTRLVETIMPAAERRGAIVLWLLTTTAERWAPRFGFEVVPREAVPDALQASQELQGACPSSAIVMRRTAAGCASSQHLVQEGIASGGDDAAIS